MSNEDDLNAKMARIGKLIKEKSEAAKNKAESGEVAPVEKVGKDMVYWPEAVAAIPTELTRVSLFGLPSDKPGERKMLRAVRLDSRSDIEVLYTGEQLGAKDETTWLACLRLGRGIPMGQRIYLNKSDLMRECGLSKTGPNWSTLALRLDRLSAAHFKVHFKRGNKTYSFTTGMLKWGIENETGAMYIRLDPDGAALFENLAYQPWDVRLSLQTDVAARLLSYISGHEHGKPHVQTLENLKRWCGYSGRRDKFRAACLAALEELANKGVLVKGSCKIAKGTVVCWVREQNDKPLAIEADPQ